MRSAADEMRLHGHLLLLVLVVLIGSSETQGNVSLPKLVLQRMVFANVCLFIFWGNSFKKPVYVKKNPA